MLIDAIEKDVDTLLQFIQQQHEQIEAYKVKLETLIEQREIVAATKDVVFGGQKRVKKRKQRRGAEIKAQGVADL